MTVQITETRNEPIIIARYIPPFDPDKDLQKANAATRSKLKSVTPPLYRIEDISRIDMTFAELVQAMGTATERAAGSLLDNRVRSMLVGTSDMLKIAQNAMQQEQYGRLRMPLFYKVDDALTHIHRQLAKDE